MKSMHVTTDGTTGAFRTGAFIFRLPDDLLEGVFHLAASSLAYGPLRSIVLVCHRFNSIGTALLYRTLHFRYDHGLISTSLAARNLYRTLRRNPSLRRHCRTLSIEISDIGFVVTPEANFPMAIEFVSWLTNVRSLRIYGGFEKHTEATWAVVRSAVQHMRHCEQLSLSRKGWGLYLSSVIEHVGFPSLKVLSIDGVSGSTPEAVFLDPKKHRTAPFTTLDISDYEYSPEATRQLLQWPKTLSHFRFGNYYHNPFFTDLPMFHSMLLIHKETLVSLDIGSLSSPGRGRLFNASDFPHLEVLKLSRWQMAASLAFSAVDADALLGPKLKTFGWDFNFYDLRGESWLDFGDREEAWLKEFARAAMARKSALMEINLSFSPDNWGGEEHGYRWDRMDRIRKVISSGGMTLSTIILQ